MVTLRTPLMFAVVFLSTFLPSTAAPLTLSSNQWRITADPEASILSVSHERLGLVMGDVQLYLREGEARRRLQQWTVEQAGEGSLLIRTENPRTAWSFGLEKNALRVACTSPHAVLTAGLPAPPERIPSRLLDPEGTPVDWVGTTEVKSGYGGDVTLNQSYLPRENPDVMYFALGQVSNRNAHSLFDRTTDTAITFHREAVMTRSAVDPNLLELVLPIPGNTTVRVTPDYYTKTLGAPIYIPFDDSVFKTAPLVWCSWTSYYADVRESDIVKNADWIADHLLPYGFGYLQIDDGYDRGPNGEHYWIEKWNQEKFPHGPAWLAGYIKSKGLKPGLWLVPNAYAGAVEEHPDWYVYFKDGKVVRDYRTPALDSSNPEVLDFLRRLFTTLDGWGFEYYKFDGEYAIPRYVPNVDLNKLHDPKADPIEVYRKRAQVIRETLGPNVFVEGCAAGTPLNAVGYYNSTFAGDDVYNSWQGMYALFSSINANAFLNHILIYLMPGEGIEVGPQMTFEEAEKMRTPEVADHGRSREYPLKGFGTSPAEARTLVSYVALTGVVYPVASVMPELPEDRVRLLKMTMPTLPILPTDLFSRGTDMSWDKFKHVTPDTYIHNYPEILDLKVNAAAGEYDVVAVTNWSGETVSRSISLADKLGLDPDTPYLAFDFWNQTPLGVVKGKLDLMVDSHDTRVIQLRKATDHPQLVGTSRHITGAQSIRSLGWDDAAKQLALTSEAVAGEPYSIWVHIPESYRQGQLKVSLDTAQQVSVEPCRTDGFVKLTITGQAAATGWQLAFGSN